VDGTSGDTYLQAGESRILNSSLVGERFRRKNEGPEWAPCELDVEVDRGAIEDLLKTAIRTVPRS